VRLQGRAGCAPASVFNALEAMGIHRAERIIRAECGTTSKGTTHHGIKQALELAGVGFQEIEEANWRVAVPALFEHVSTIGPAIICTEQGDHWEAAIGTTAETDRIIIFNSDRHWRNRAKNGIHVLSRRQMVNYWEKVEGKHYALLLVPKS
jgi:ABC-type bacteriocin/lantibiotic exporter with double-glycine peptidase domain